jgi:hypothetical protein
MAKNKKEEQSQEVTLTPLPEEAFTMRFNPSTSMFEVVKVSFDFETKEARLDGVISESRNEYKTLDALKLSLGKYLTKMRIEKYEQK